MAQRQPQAGWQGADQVKHGALYAGIKHALGAPQAMQHKAMRACVKSAEASPEQLVRIRAFTLADIPPEKLYVRTYVVAHNAIDRDGEVFSAPILNDFARTLPGKGLHIKHPNSFGGDNGPAKGRWFEATVERMSFDAARALLREPTMQWSPDETEAALLTASAYQMRTAGNADLLDEIDAGIAGDVSIGFTAKSRDRISDASGRELNVFRINGPGEALEASLVWLGAQPGARAIKHAGQTKDTDMELREQLDAALAEVARLKALVDANAQSAKQFGALKAALPESADVLDQPLALAALVSAGKSYRDELIDTVVAAERRMGVVGDSDADVAAAKTLHANEPVTRLKALSDHYQKAAPKPAIAGSDPNPQRPGEGALAKGHILSNPLFAGSAATA